MRTDPLSNPILNPPFAEPARHFELGSHGPTGEVLEGRRPSESFVPVPKTRKGRNQQALDFDVVGDRREENSLINDIRRALARPESGKIAVKVINDWGDEVLKVHEV